jgi:TonB-linked SusC/RagA family outer membrane protein
MKKFNNEQWVPLNKVCLKKTFRIMKLTTILFLVTIFNLFGSKSYSQYARLNLDLKDVPIVTVLNTIEGKSKFFFLYSSKMIDVNRRVDINVTDKKITEVLDELLANTDIKYVVRDRQILLINKEAERDLGLQQKKITGTVTAKDGAPLAGVNVVVPGTTVGVITDADGKYTIEVPQGSKTLSFSFIGMTPQEIPIGSSTQINATMQEEAIGLDEVVVIGYGTAKKSDLTGAVSAVKSDEIVRINPVLPTQALQGQVAGVNINRINSRPGSDYTIDIRGLHSISFSSEPLVVIDGVMGGKLNTLNPSDIQTMNVLKDASATAIYGSRGANGVIIITTKRGTQGKPKVTYEGYLGIKVPSNLPDLMTGPEWFHAYNDVVKAEVPTANPIWTTAELANVAAGNTVDWVDLVTDPAPQTSHVIALSGGNENTTYYFSGGYLNESGNLLNTGYERYNLKGTVDSKINKVIRAGFTAYYTYSKRNLGSNETLRGAYRVLPIGTVYYDDLTNPTETNDKNVDGYAFWMGIKDTQVQNPLLEVQDTRFKDETIGSNFLGNAFIELTPLKGLSFKSSLSANIFNSRQGIFINTDAKARLNKLPSVSLAYNINSSYTLDNILNYKLTSGAHNVDMTLGNSVLNERYESSGIQAENLTYTSYWYAIKTAAIINGITSNLIERSILSFMGRFNYSYNSKYLLTLTGRYDGSSVLAEGNKWAFFPSVAVAWRAGDEEFIKSLNVFSDLKLRISYGEVGNDVVAPYSTQAFLRKTAYDFGGVAAYGYAPNNIGNSDLKWENSKEENLGLNMGFLKNRITADIELYYKTTSNLIQNVAIPTSLGFGSVTANVGKLLNRGIEITLNTVNVQKKDFRWTTSINFSSNHNEILELYGGTVTKDYANKLFVGESLRTNFYYKFDGIWQTADSTSAAVYSQVPGSVKVVDQNKDNKISSSTGIDDRVVLGNELPDWIAGINNMVSYKNFDFSFFIYTRQGVQFRSALLSGTMGELNSNRYNRLNLNYWTKENPTNDYFGVWQPEPYREAIQYQDASFWRVSNITLGYTLPKTVLDRLKIGSIRCYVQANNPFVFTKNNNYWMDPEFNSGTYQDDVPFASYIFGVSASF